MKAVILAAGLGIRLNPLTNNILKSMIPVGGKPLLEYIISELSQSSFNDICLVVGHKQETIRNYFKDGRKFGVKIQYVEQKKLQGTAHAVMLTKNFVGNDSFLLYLADTIIPEGLHDLIKKMKENSTFFDIISSKINKKTSENVGHILVKNDNVIQILEKPKESISNFAWAGVAFFKNNYIFEILDELKISQTGEFEITEALNLALNKKFEIHNHTCKEFIDFGTSDGLLRINKFLLSKKDFQTVRTFKIFSKIIEPVFIGKNCKVGINVRLGPYVSIGNDVILNDNVSIKNSLVLDDVNIKKEQKFVHTIIFPNGFLTIH